MARPFQGSGVKAENGPPGGRSRKYAWRHEFKHPREVLGGHEVESPPHGPRPEDVSCIERRVHAGAAAVLGAQGDRGEGALVVLGLGGGQPSDGIGGNGEAGACEALGGEAQQGHVVQRDGRRSY